MKPSIVPADSSLRWWIQSLSVTEIPVGYQVLCGLSAIGALLRRSVYVDQARPLQRCYPNMSVLLVGPSGIGKDQVINAASDLVEAVDPALPSPAGKTVEFLKYVLLQRGDPACAFVTAGELRAWLGTREYQANIVSEVTDLLSTGKKVDASTKGAAKAGERLVIPNPTVTVQAGSTMAWIQKLPPDALEGGFFARFVIICAGYPRKHVAWTKYDPERQEVVEAEGALGEFTKCAGQICARFAGRKTEFVPDDGAKDFYRNWYHNRFKYFGPLARDYANRSRDHMHRLAMLMAVTRGHEWLEETDYVFAAEVFKEVAAGIEGVLRRRS